MVPPCVTKTTQIKTHYDVLLRIMPWGGGGVCGDYGSKEIYGFMWSNCPSKEKNL